MIDILPFRRELQDAVTSMILSIQNSEFGFDLTLEEQIDLVDIQRSYAASGGQFWVALDGDVVIGSAAAFNLGDGHVDLRRFFVQKEYRGGQPSLAQRLLDETISWAQVNEFKHMYLETAGRYVAARRMYERNGFREINASQLPPTFPVIRVAEHFYYRGIGVS